jgi:hypothetical protein
MERDGERAADLFVGTHFHALAEAGRQLEE